ncbi:hypothetical protein RHECNPAF_430094 [Rhizobium etli CNPAF512]|nr:hypothetical protein RHECNPAF_430094 [Rhizobium etli CNPAF512]
MTSASRPINDVLIMRVKRMVNNRLMSESVFYQ